MTAYQPPPPPAQAETDAAASHRRPMRLRPRRFLLRVVLPLALYVVGLLCYGMHLGAREPDAWYSRAANYLLE